MKKFIRPLLVLPCLSFSIIFVVLDKVDFAILMGVYAIYFEVKYADSM